MREKEGERGKEGVNINVVCVETYICASHFNNYSKFAFVLPRPSW